MFTPKLQYTVDYPDWFTFDFYLVYFWKHNEKKLHKSQKLGIFKLHISCLLQYYHPCEKGLFLENYNIIYCRSFNKIIFFCNWFVPIFFDIVFFITVELRLSVFLDISGLFLCFQFGQEYLLVMVEIRSHHLFKTTAFKSEVKASLFRFEKVKAVLARVVTNEEQIRWGRYILKGEVNQFRECSICPSWPEMLFLSWSSDSDPNIYTCKRTI